MSKQHDDIPQTRWAWAEIDLEAVRHNVRAFRGLLNPPVRLMCVVKADAYGHGAVQVARAARAAGADAFAVSTVDEAVELRTSGVRQPILVLSQPPVTSIPTLVSHGIMPAAYDLEFLARLGEEATQQQVEARYHLAVDTGMSRIGVIWDKVAEFVRIAERLDGIRLDGTFTHFATAYKSSDWDFTLQLNRFRKATAAMQQAGVNPGVRHCANTAAIALHPESHMDMVRLGVGIYGLHPSPETVGMLDLHPVMSIHARVTRVEKPQVGEGVSYGLTYRVARPSIQVATLPLGYADGLSRVLSNKMQVLFDGLRWRQVGTICMDQCMVEIEPELARLSGRGSRAIEVGDEVVIMGRQQSGEITASELAELADTIDYEIVTSFGIRLPKRFLNLQSCVAS